MRVRSEEDIVSYLPQTQFLDQRVTSPRFEGAANETEALIAQAKAWRPDWAGGYLDQGGSPLKSTKTMVDVIVPNFSERLAAGEFIPTNPCTSDRVVPCYDELYMEWRYISLANAGRRVTATWSRTWRLSEPPLPALLPASSYDPLIIKARSEMQSGFMDALTSVSEFHKTIEMIVGFKKRIRQALLELVETASKKGLLRGVKTVGKAMEILAQFWLEFRFGWRILWYEYNSIVEVVNSLDLDFVRRSFRARDTRSEINESEWLPVLPGVWEAKHLSGTSITQSAGCTGTVKMGGRVLIDPLTTAWELLPLSWVIDTAWNVGDLITGISPFGTVDEDEVWTSLRRESYATSEYRMIFRPGIPNSEIMRQEVVRHRNMAERADYRRSRYDGSITLPSPNFNPSLLKALDLGSVLVVLRGSLLNVIKNNRV